RQLMTILKLTGPKILDHRKLCAHRSNVAVACLRTEHNHRQKQWRTPNGKCAQGSILQVSKHVRTIVVCLSAARGAMLLICLRLLVAQTVAPTPGSIQDLAGQIALPDHFSFEAQLQQGTQGNSNDGNPFAYVHGVQIRPWVHYDGIPNTTIT